MIESRTVVETASGPRLIRRLCKHWAHRLEVDADQGRVVFDGGVCHMRATEERLEVRLEASDAERLARLQGVVASHLERLAGKERLSIVWP